MGEFKYANEYWVTVYGNKITSIKIKCPYCERKLPIQAMKRDQAHVCVCGRVFIEISRPDYRIIEAEEDPYPPCGMILNNLN